MSTLSALKTVNRPPNWTLPSGLVSNAQFTDENLDFLILILIK